MPKNQREIASEARRRAVLKAAGWQFAEAGYKGTTAEQIASAAGVSKGLVFHLFGSKEKLFDSVLEDGIAQWAMLSEYRAGDDDSAYANTLRNLFVASFDFIEQHPILLLLMREQGSERMQSGMKKVASGNRRWRKRIEKTLSDGIDAGQFKPGIDIVRTAIIFHALQISLIQSMYKQGKIQLLDRKLIEQAANIIVDSVIT